KVSHTRSERQLGSDVFSFFFQAEDGIRDRNVTGVQTCALPICRHRSRNGPAKGPTIVNGSSRIANAPATALAVARFCGEKKNRVASPSWNIPSPHFDTSRTVNSLQKRARSKRNRRSTTQSEPQETRG